MTNRTDEPGAAGATLETLELVDGPCGFDSFGELLSTFRMCDEMSQAELGRTLGVSGSYICRVENGEELVGPAMAAACAAAVGYPATVFVERALQDQLDGANLRMEVCVEVAENEGSNGPGPAQDEVRRPSTDPLPPPGFGPLRSALCPSSQLRYDYLASR